MPLHWRNFETKMPFALPFTRRKINEEKERCIWINIDVYGYGNQLSYFPPVYRVGKITVVNLPKIGVHL